MVMSALLAGIIGLLIGLFIGFVATCILNARAVHQAELRQSANEWEAR